MDIGTITGAVVMQDLATAVLQKIQNSVVQLNSSIQGTSKNISQSTTAMLGNITNRFSQFGGELSTVGRQLSFGVGAPLAYALKSSSQAAIEFESTLKKIQTLAGVSANDIGYFRDQILALSAETATGPMELANSLYLVASAGRRGRDALEIVKLAAQGSAIGMGDASVIAKALTSEMNAMGDGSKTATQAMDELFVSVREGAAEAKDLAPVIGRVIGAARLLGVSFAESGSFIATFTRLGINASEAVTSLSAVFSNLMKPSAQADKMFERAGISAEKFRETVAEKGLTKALLELIDALKGDDEAIAKVFGNIRALRGVLANADAQAKAYVTVTKAMSAAHGEFAKAVMEMSKTTKWSWDTMVAQLQATSIRIGNILKPVWDDVIKVILQNVIPTLEKVIKAFSELPEATRKAAVGFLLLLAVSGPFLWWLGTVIELLAILGRSLIFTAGLIPKEAFLNFNKAIFAMAAALRELLVVTALFGARGFALWFAQLAAGTPILGTFLAWVGKLTLALRGVTLAQITANFSLFFAQIVSNTPVLGSFIALLGRLGTAMATFSLAQFGRDIALFFALIVTRTPILNTFLATLVGIVSFARTATLGSLFTQFSLFFALIASRTPLLSALLIKLGEFAAVMSKLSFANFTLFFGLLTSKTPLLGTFLALLGEVGETIVKLPVSTLVSNFGLFFSLIISRMPILGTFLSTLGSISGIIRGISFTGLIAGLSSLVVPITLVVAAIGALVLAIRYLTGSWDFLTKPIAWVIDLLSDLYVIAKDRLGKVLIELAQAVSGILVNAWVKFKEAVALAVERISTGFKSMIDWFKLGAGSILSLVDPFGVLIRVLQGVGSILSWAAGQVKEFAQWLASWIPWAINIVSGWIDKFIEKWNQWKVGLWLVRQEIKQTADEIRAVNALQALLPMKPVALHGPTPIPTPDIAAVNTALSVQANTAKEAKLALISLSKQYDDIVKQLKSLTAEQVKNIEAGFKMGYSASDIADAMRLLYKDLELSTSAIEVYQKQMQEASKSGKEAAKILADLSDSLEKFVLALVKISAVGGGDIAAGLASISSAGLEEVQKSAETLLAVYDQLGERAPAYLLAILPAVQAVYDGTIRLLEIREGPTIFGQISREINALLPLYDTLTRASSEQLQAWLDGINKAIEANRQLGAEVPKAWYDTKEAILSALQTQYLMNEELQKVTDRLHGIKPPEELAAGIQKASEATLGWLQTLNQADLILGKIQARNMAGALGESLFDWAVQYQEDLVKINYGMDEFGKMTELGKRAVDALGQSAVAKLKDIASSAGLIVDGFGSMVELLQRIAKLIPGLDLSKILTPEVIEDLKLLQGATETKPPKNAIAKFFEDALGDAAKFGEKLSNIIVSAFKNGGDVLRGIFGSIFGDLGSQLGEIFSDAGKELGKASGAMYRALGAAMGPLGAALGGMLGDWIGKLFGPSEGAILGKKADEEIKKLQDELLKTYGSIEAIRKAGGAAGEALAAAWGSKNVAGLEHFKKLLDDFNKSVEDHKKLVEDLITTLGELADAQFLLTPELILKLQANIDDENVRAALYELVKASTEAAVEGLTAYLNLGLQMTTGLKKAQDEVNSLRDKQEDLIATITDLEGKSYLTERQKRQLEQAYQDLDRVNQELGDALNLIDRYGSAVEQIKLSPEVASAMQAGLGGLFGQLLAEGKTPYAAITALTPAIQNLDNAMKSAGLTTTMAFDSLIRLAGLATDEVTGPLLQAIAGLGQGLVSLHNAGLLTQDMFLGMARGAYDAFHALELQGKGGTDALRMMQPTLQRIWELQQDFGYEVDENTQRLLDFAEANGLVGDKFRPAADKMLSALEAIATKFDILINLLERILPQSAASGAQQVNNALDRIDFSDVEQRGVDAFNAIEEAATSAAWGSSPTGIKEISIATDKAVARLENFTDSARIINDVEQSTVSAIDRLRQFGDYAVQAFNSVDEMTAFYAHAMVNSADEMGRAIQDLSLEWEEIIATPLKQTLNSMQRETLESLAKFQDDPRYDMAIELAQQIARQRRDEAAWAERNRMAAEANQATSNNPPVEQVIVVHLDRRVITQATIHGMPDVVRVLSR